MYKNIVIAILVIIVFLFIKDKSEYIGQSSVIVDTDTVYQQKTFTKYIKGKSIPFVVLDTIYNIDEVHDTITIVKDYNQVKVYSDTMRIDSLGYAYIQDTISQNKIQGRSFKAEINEKTIYVTKTIIPKPKKEVYLGVIGDLRAFDNKLGLGLGLGYKTPKNGLFTINATTNHYSLGYYKKLF
jgi:hypothetical protein